MLRGISTKVIRPVPREFEAMYVKHGHAACEEMYGKRPTARYKRIIGRVKLNRLRKTAVAGGADGGTGEA